jgi:Subtilisin inhibitor-like
MRLLFAGAFVLLAAAAAPAQSSSTSLRVTVWPQGPDGERVEWTLRCNPVGGTLPRRVAACRRLASLERPFAAIATDAVCTMIYGGPARARVTGTYRGRRVWAAFSREDGCRIGRWQRHGFLFPVSLGGG